MTDIKAATAPHRVWAEIELDSLIHNFHTARNCAPKSSVMPVIKADAYGHGAVMAARALAGEKAGILAVATVDEALELRDNGINQPVLLLGTAPRGAVRELAGKNVMLTISSLDYARYCAETLRGETINAHIKLDTGMRRLGVDATGAADAADVMSDIAAVPGIRVSGLFTHIAAADDRCEDTFTARQLDLFRKAACEFECRTVRRIAKHSANSASLLMHPDTHMDYVRPGILLYGYGPVKESALMPVMSLRAAIMQVNNVRAGESVGYNRAWTAPRDSVIATVSIGYADGLMRGLSGKMDMLVRGKRAAQVGNICMDFCMLDVTGIPGVAQGDTATVFGCDGGEAITADELAGALGTIPYEILCAVSKRVHRIYVRDGKVVEN